MVSDQVAKASLIPPNEPKGRVKSDDFLKKKENDDFMESIGRRKYVKHSVEHDKKRPAQLRPSIPFAAGGQSDSDAESSDALPMERRGHLLDYNRMTMQFDAAMGVLKKTKPAAAKAIEERGALPKAFEANSGVKIFTLLNGIGVNMKELSSGKLRAPYGENGTAVIEVVSLGGRSVEKDNLKGVCEMYEMGVEDFMVAQYSRSGNARVDQEMFPTALQQRAARYRSKEKGSLSERVGKPGPPDGPKVKCASEFIRLHATLSSSCPDSGIDNDPIPCSTDSIMDRDDVIGVLGDLRLKMMPIFTARSVREAYGKLMEDRTREKRLKNPRDFIKSQAESSILETAFPNDKRLRRPEPDDIKRLNPDDASRWVREQFFPDRIEINVVGDFSEKSVLTALQIMFGTLPTVNTKDKESMSMAGYDIYKPSDTKHFKRTWPSSPATNKIGCYVVTDNVGRAFPALMVPAQDKITFRGGEMRTVVSAMMEKNTMEKD